MRARGASFVILTASCLPGLSLYAEGARFEDLYREALARREENLGPRHPEVARSLAHLALFLNVRGRTAEAEPLLRRALAIDEQAFGQKHERVADDLTHLGDILAAGRNYAQAETAFRRALAIREPLDGGEDAAAIPLLKKTRRSA